MGVVSLYGFRTLPGKLDQHMAASEEARQLLSELGQQAMTLQTIAGSEAGIISTVLNHSDSREWAKATQEVMTNPRWVEFYSRVSAEAIAEPVENSQLVDLDPTFTPDPARPLGAAAITQWMARPGRAGDFLEQVGVATGHLARLGGTPRVFQCLMGRFPMSVVVAITYEDLEHLGEANDKLAVDEQWAGFWATVMADPPAELVRSQVAVIRR